MGRLERSLSRHSRFREARVVPRFITARCCLPTARTSRGHLVHLVVENRTTHVCRYRQRLRRHCVVGSIVHHVSMTMWPNNARARVKTPRATNAAKNRRSQFGYSAFLFSSKVIRTLFSFCKIVFSEFSHRLALQRTAAGRCGCNRRALWPPSLSSPLR